MPDVFFVRITCSACGRNEKVVRIAAKYPTYFIGGDLLEYNVSMITGFSVFVMKKNEFMK
jgi:hypothetical protein